MLNLAGGLAYGQFEIVVKLETVMRQQVQGEDADQKLFMELLPRLRNGDCTIEDWKHLMKRTPTIDNNLEFENAIRLFSTNKECDEYNLEKLSLLKSPITALYGTNTTPNGRSIDEDHFRGLMNVVYLANNTQIVLTTNIWKKHGLTNGAMGIIKAIIYPLEKSETILPDTILIHFLDYDGPQFFKDNSRKNWIPLNALSVFCTITKNTRKNFPIRLGYASTIHKVQGATLKSGVVDLGKNERSLGTAFVALSRFKRFEGFLVQPFSLDRITSKIKKSTMLAPIE